MAGRSLGAGLIAALLGWTVNQPTWGVKAHTLGQRLWRWQELHLPINLNLPLRGTTAALMRVSPPNRARLRNALLLARFDALIVVRLQRNGLQRIKGMRWTRPDPFGA